MSSKIFLLAGALFCLPLAAQVTINTPIYQIPAGQLTYLVGDGIDEFYSGGSADRNQITPGLVDRTYATTDLYETEYLTERVGTFTYTLPGLTAGQAYILKLHFTENWYTGPKQREFNVAINGQPYLTNFDIFAEAGAGFRAIVKTYAVTANSAGQIVVAFTPGAYQIPKVSALELFPVYAPSSGATSASASVSYQIGCGNPATAGSWLADEYYSSGANTHYTNTINTSGVNNPAPATVYQYERSGNFSYTLPWLAPGEIYTVRLHFSENLFTKPGQRQFNVSINGFPVLPNFDIFAAAGGAGTAIVEAFPAAANSAGQIVIAFSQGAVGVAKVDGIEVVTGYRINAGGSGASYFEADQSYVGGGDGLNGQSVSTAQATDPAPIPVYQSQRYGPVTYVVHSLTPGATYGVRLHFNEQSGAQVGQRQFDVLINGIQVLTDYDIIGVAGPNTANVQSFSTVANSAGQIVVATTIGSAGGPEIDGLEFTGGAIIQSSEYVVSGSVLLGGSGPSANTGVANATVTLSGGLPGIAITNSSGAYSFVVTGNLTYTITASLAGYSMSSPIHVAKVTTSIPNQNFTASLTTGGTLAPQSPNKEYIFMNGSIVAVEHPH